MSLVTYTNYTSVKPVADLNAKVKRLVKRTKKVEEEPQYKFFPMNAHKRIKLPSPTFDLQKEADKIKPYMEKRTSEDEESIRNHDEHSFYAVEQYCRENDLEFDYDEHKALVDESITQSPILPPVAVTSPVMLAFDADINPELSTEKLEAVT